MLSPKIKNNLLTSWLVFTASVLIFASTSRPVQAQFVVTNTTVSDLPRLLSEAKNAVKDKVKEAVKKTLEISAARALQQAVRSVSYKFAQDTAVWIASGAKGQRPLLFKNFQNVMENVGNEVAGKFIVNLSQGLPVDLCSPSSIKSLLAINIGINKSLGNVSRDTGRRGCKFSEITKNFAAVSLRKDFLINVSTGFEPGKNELSVSNKLLNEAEFMKERAIQKEIVDRFQKGDFDNSSVEEIQKIYPSLSVNQIESLENQAYAQATKVEPTKTNNLFVDTATVFANTLTKAYLQRLAGGYYPFKESRRSGPDSELTGSDNSLAAVVASFNVFSPDRAAKITEAGVVDLLSDMLTCPPAQYQTPYNCLLNDGLQQAVQQNLTLSQALAKGLLDPNMQFPQAPDSERPVLSLANLKKLRLLRVLPIGWELAGEQIASSTVKTLALGEVVKCFDADSQSCHLTKSGGTENLLAGLMDPKWILTLPPQYCRAEGISNVPEQEQSATRRSYCVDLQSCIKTNNKGDCAAYGYCTRERQTWQLSGEQCDKQYATCQVFTRLDGSTVGTSTTPGILSSDINKNGCTQANAGCTWFGDNSQATGSGRIYLTDQAPLCRAEDAGSREIIPLEVGTNLISSAVEGQTVGIKPYTYYTFSFSATGASALTATVSSSQALDNVSFSRAVAKELNLDLAQGSAGRYAATFFSQGANSVTINFNNSGYSSIQLEEISLNAGKEAANAMAANSAAGVKVLNFSPVGSFNPASPATAYKPYDKNRKLVFAGANECSAEEASARRYTPQSGNAEAQVARLTPSGLCAAACVGMDSYLAMPTPLELIASSAAPTRESFVATAAESCRAAEVGCEEFTNLAPTASGEQRTYFNAVRSCVLDTNPKAATFYTWEGTDTAGFQLKSWRLLKDDSGAPCNDFPQGSQADPGSSTTRCTAVTASCTVSSDNPDCRVFLDETGKEYKRDTTKIVTASSQCAGYRRTNDGKTWYFLASESKQCSAQAVGCREYKGGRANLVRNVLESNFEKGNEGGWDHGEVGGVSYNIGGGSYQITAGDDGNISYNFPAGTASFVGKTYLLSFDAKASAVPATIDLIRLKVTVEGEPQERRFVNVDNPLAISNDWAHYQVGPVSYGSMGQAYDNILPQFLIRAQGATVYIDNIKLSEVEDRLFALKNSTKPQAQGGKQPDACYDTASGATAPKYQSCTAYNDDNNNTFYVARFDRIFGPDSAYCRAVIDTQNSNAVGEENFNGPDKNNDLNDNYKVLPDALEYRIIKPENLRPAAAAGCTALNVPKDINDARADFSGVAYRLVDPDTFLSGSMCQAAGLGCKSFKTKQGESFVFRDPGNHLCIWSDADKAFVKQTPDGTIARNGNKAAMGCYDDSDNVPVQYKWVGVGQCPASQNTCTAYAPVDPTLTEGANTALFMLKDSVEKGSCTQGQDSIASGCVKFTEGYSAGDIRPDGLYSVATPSLAVKPTRECAEWLAPTTSSEVTDPKTHSKRTVVYALGRCRELGADGRCTLWANQTKAVLGAATYQDRDKREFAGKNIFSGAWDYSGYSVPGKPQVELLDKSDFSALSCRSYPEEDAPYTIPGLKLDVKTGKYIYSGTAWEKLNKCEPGDVCECSYKKIITSDQEGIRYFATSTQAVFPAATESITNLTGWQGYCVEYDNDTKDPNGNPVCLTWWPVDVPSEGTNIFDNHPEAGFSMSGPMYYCAQAKGNKIDDTNYGIKPISQANNNYFLSVRNVFTDEPKNFAVIKVKRDKDENLFFRPLSFRFDNSVQIPGSYNWVNSCDWIGETGSQSCKKKENGGEYPPTNYGINKDSGWKDASGILPFPVNYSSPLFQLHEYDIEKIILKTRKPPVGGINTDWPVATEQLILQRDGWANNGETTSDRWTALWCDGTQCDFGKDGYTWDKFAPFIEDSAVDPTIDKDGAVSKVDRACSGSMAGSKTNLLGIRAVFADENGKIPGQMKNPPEDFYKRLKIAQAESGSSQVFVGWNSFMGNVKPYQFLGLEGGLCDGSAQEGWVDFDIGIQLREWCSVVAKVDEGAGNKAWTGRLNQNSATSFPPDDGSIYNANDKRDDNKGSLNNLFIEQNGGPWSAYYSQDSAPFGSIVPPASTIYHPDLWDSRKDEEDQDPLTPQAEPKLLEPGQQPLYVETNHKQTRAGTPYSCEGDACVLPPTDKGLKLKDGSNLGKAMTYILQLFGRVQSIWKWEYQGAPGRAPGYALDNAETNIDLTNLKYGNGYKGQCPVIQALTIQADAEFQFRNQARFEGNCTQTAFWGAYSINSKTINNSTRRLADNYTPISVDRGEPVSLQFYAYNENGEQLPLKKIEIDWNDGEATVISGSFKNHKPECSADANYGGTANACSVEYFQFQHVYQKIGSFTPTVRVTDNWGIQTMASYTAGSETLGVIRVETSQARLGLSLASGAAESDSGGRACTADKWTCSLWGICSATGQQTRTCSLTEDCPFATTPSPALSQNCTNGGWSGWSNPAGFNDGARGTCSAPCGTGQQTRTCTNPAPAGEGQLCPVAGGQPTRDAQIQNCNIQACADKDDDKENYLTDCDDNDRLTHHGSTYKGTVSKDYNCDKTISSETKCTANSSAYGKAVPTCPGANNNFNLAKVWCDANKHNPSTPSSLPGYCNPYNEITCFWCSATQTLYW